MKDNKYIYADIGGLDLYFFRLGGPGLCNLLFPWSRMIIEAKKRNLTIIPTTWASLKIGPYLRSERDKRSYHDFFISESNISLFKKILLLSFHRSKILRINNNKITFSDLCSHNILISHEISKLVKQRHLNSIKNFSGKGVVVHIRMGDFKNEDNETSLRKGVWNKRIPLLWYKSIINKLTFINNKIKIYVFSDADDHDLQEILDIKNVQRSYFGSAISDLLALSKGKILVASASTFSMWASFLGQNHTIWFPGQMRSQMIENKNIFEGEVDYNDALSQKIIDYVVK